jgi:hypothetical protein
MLDTESNLCFTGGMEIEITTNNRKWGETCRHATVVVDVKLRKADGRYYVERRANGHKLGWVIKTDEGWRAMTTLAAYWPADADIMTRTEAHRSHRAGAFEGEHVGFGRTREEAVFEIVGTLISRSAESVQPDFEATFPESA